MNTLTSAGQPDAISKPAALPNLHGRVAIVTGANSGIGKGIAMYLAKAGASVVIDYVQHPEAAVQAEREAQSDHGDVRICRADITKAEERDQLVAYAWEQFGYADILVNNAGLEIRSDFWDVTEEDYNRVLDVNLRGSFFLAQTFVRRLRQNKRPGRIINISSVHEDMAFPGFSTYCCSKGALRMLTRTLAVELGPLGITINNIAPGAIATPINKSLLEDAPKLNALLANIPLHRLGTPEDIAPLVAFLASESGSYVSGATFVIDGGLMRSYHEQ